MPPPGYAVSYLDFEQQEFAIAAALSGDPNMMEAYRSGDPYLEFGKQTGGLPEWATKETHPQIREGFKQTALGVQYGMSDSGLSRKLKSLGLDGSTAHAKNLLHMHRETYRVFWKWSEGAVHFAIYLVTTLGWIDTDRWRTF
jgi:DNA polymerase I